MVNLNIASLYLLVIIIVILYQFYINIHVMVLHIMMLCFFLIKERIISLKVFRMRETRLTKKECGYIEECGYVSYSHG